MRTVKQIWWTLLISGVVGMGASPAFAQAAGPQSIVGSWMGTAGNGEVVVLASFTPDGIALGSAQGQISLNSPSLTTIHGAWTHLGGRQFTSTNIALLYDVQTGQYQGYIKIRLFLTVREDGDEVSGTDKVQIFDTGGALVNTFPETAVTYKRIKVEPFN